MTPNPIDRHARLRSRLLESLKFRVLASQDLFFRDTAGDQRRDWLRRVHPEALELEDRDLDRVWNQAKQLYTESWGLFLTLGDLKSKNLDLIGAKCCCPSACFVACSFAGDAAASCRQ